MDTGLFSSPTAKLVEEATSEHHLAPDWGINMEICDAINSADTDTAATVASTLKKRIHHSNPKIAVLGLTVAETCVKNCGEKFYDQVGERTFMNAMEEAARSNTPDVRDKALGLIAAWKESLSRSYPEILDSFQKYAFECISDNTRLRLEGAVFPAVDLDENAPIITPPARVPGESRADPHSLSADPYGRDSGVLYEDAEADFAPQQLVAEETPPLQSDADKVKDTIKYFNSLLDMLEKADYEENILVKNLSDQCELMKTRIQTILESESDESIVTQHLELYESLEKVIKRAQGEEEEKPETTTTTTLLDLSPEPLVSPEPAVAPAVGISLGAQPHNTQPDEMDDLSQLAMSRHGAVEPAVVRGPPPADDLSFIYASRPIDSVIPPKSPKEGPLVSIDEIGVQVDKEEDRPADSVDDLLLI